MGNTKGEPIVLCPVSGTKGKLVKTVTLRSLLKEEHQERITQGRYRFCDAQGCDVVYFAEDGSHVFTKADLKVRVGVKETDAPRPICYCFNHTVEEIFDEIQRTGTSTRRRPSRRGISWRPFSSFLGRLHGAGCFWSGVSA